MCACAVSYNTRSSRNIANYSKHASHLHTHLQNLHDEATSLSLPLCFAVLIDFGNARKGCSKRVHYNTHETLCILSSQELNFLLFLAHIEGEGG